MTRGILIGCFLVTGVWGATKPEKIKSNFTLLDRPEKENYTMTQGEVWNYLSNYGNLGGEASVKYYGYSWPGGAAVNNYYLWLGYFWVGTKVNNTAYVTHHDYIRAEWGPSEEPTTRLGVGKSAYDVYTAFDDFTDNSSNSSGRHLGIKVLIRGLSWPHEPYNDFIAHEIYLIYDKTQSDIPGAGDILDSVYISTQFDADVCGSDQVEPHIDDLVAYDGWTNGEWTNPSFKFQEPIDRITLLPDSSYEEKDNIYDNYVIWGDEEEEKIVDTTHAQWITLGDTSFWGYVFPRGISYIYDSDNPKDPASDVGESGACAGYLGGGWLYTPQKVSDSIWTVGNDTLRIVRPWSHQWWNWESDPATDEDMYSYMQGAHPATHGYRYAPHPYDLGASEFDYRFLHTVGPFQIANGETLKLVYVAGVGQGLNGGQDSYWQGGKWVHGLRNVIDWAYKAYYAGAQHSDPLHPSDPDQDTHWYIPIPPSSPTLEYTATPKGVKLVWDNSPEITPDPLKGKVDFKGYIIYRAMYEPLNWVVLDSLEVDPVTGLISHTYVDTTAIPGFLYYYVVTAFDTDSLESSKNNYKKTEAGSPIATTPPTEIGTLKDIKVTPNPFLGAAPWTATGIQDKIEFRNVPKRCRIQIFTLSGDLVRTLDNQLGTGTIAWDLLSKESQKVVSGVYYYKAETEDGQYRLGKFMILR